MDFSIPIDQTAGAKAKIDSDTIFKDSGYKSLFSHHIQTNKVYINKILNIILGIISLTFIKKGSVITTNYPPNLIDKKIVWNYLYKIKRIKKIKLIILIHDLDFIRNNDNDSNQEKKYIEQLDVADAIIVHNTKMIDLLVEKGLSKDKLIDLKIFDYLADIKSSGGSYGNKFIVAGNLDIQKSKYLSKISKIDGIYFNLYGPGYNQNDYDSDKSKYYGSFPSESIPNVIQGSYGLVWDSEELSGGVGPYGDYQRYNNPHKTSLYLAAGFPVVVWEKAALAPFIVENNLGFVVDNLDELPSKIEEISEDEYNRMKLNVKEIGQKICSGYFLNEALKKVETVIEENK